METYLQSPKISRSKLCYYFLILPTAVVLGKGLPDRSLYNEGKEKPETGYIRMCSIGHNSEHECHE